MALIIVCLPRFNWAQIQLIVFLQSLTMIFQGIVRPYEMTTQNRMEMFDEIMIMLNCYFLFMFTEYMPDRELRYTLGWVNIGFLATLLLVNMLVIFGRKVKKAIRFCELTKIKRDNKRRMMLGKAI